MGRKPNPPEQRRQKLNLAIHPDIRAWADQISLKRRRSVSQLFEDLVEAEWLRYQAAQTPPAPAPGAQAPVQQFHPAPYPWFHAPPQAPQIQQ